MDGAFAPVRRVVGVIVALADEYRRVLRLSASRNGELHSALRQAKAPEMTNAAATAVMAEIVVFIALLFVTGEFYQNPRTETSPRRFES